MTTKPTLSQLRRRAGVAAMKEHLEKNPADIRYMPGCLMDSILDAIDHVPPVEPAFLDTDEGRFHRERTRPERLAAMDAIFAWINVGAREDEVIYEIRRRFAARMKIAPGTH